ncbi:MAG: alpha/beta hydrolase [Erysipelotrichaceae bacterium]|nr:alpha/beta hydrolase [Erysipelotrichaceae bacterium]
MNKMSLISSYIRKQFAKGDRARDAGLVTPEDVLRYDDIVYGTDRKWQSLDVYRPKNREGKLPVIISVHGGGWVYGDKEVYQFYCMSLAQRGFAVINFNYRLAPETKYPAQIKDTNSVIRWMRENADEYGFDLNNVFAVGDSAGGQLLSAYCCIICNESYGKLYDMEVPEDFSFNAVALNCGVYQQKMCRKTEANYWLLNDVFGKGWGEKQLDLLNTYDKITEAFPPAFVMSATGDFLLGQVDVIKPELEKNGIEHIVRIYGTADNKLGHVFHVNVRSNDATICNDEECEFFRKHIR